MTDNGCTMHLVANTHWDREWHFTVEQTRPILRDKITLILDTLDADPDFGSFLLDGQSVILDDYMIVCPEERERVTRLMREGRLFAGPWYSLPDEFIVSGESIVRNILIGHQTADEFGGSMKVAYTPCSYGQISQMPQIWRGFGIDAALFYRGVRNDLTERIFRWEGADDSQIMVYRYGKTGRTDFYWQVLRPAVYDKERQRTVDWGDDGVLFHLCDDAAYRGDYYTLDAPNFLIADERLKNGIEQLKQDHFVDVPVRDHLLFMVGSDCTAPHPRMVELVEETNKQIAASGDKLVISSIPAYIDAVKERIAIEDLKTSLSGELHEAVQTSGSALLESVISSRMYLKQANDATEIALQNWAEPTATIAWRLGREYPQGFLRRAWKTMLACHPHDSICGVSIDDVCDDMMNRFREARECGEGVAEAGLKAVVSNIDLADADEKDIFLTVFNPLPWGRDAVVKAMVDIPSSLPGKVDAVELTAPDGSKTAVQHFTCREAVGTVQHPDDMVGLLPSTRVEIAFEAKALPAMGYRTWRVEARRGGFLSATSLVAGPCAMENELVRVEIESNGTLTVTNKTTGRSYSGLNAFEDTGDIGIGWRAERPQADPTVYSHGAEAAITLVESGPLQAAFDVALAMRVPKQRTDNRIGRSEEMVDIDICSRVTLKAGARMVEIETTVNNRARHHRLRALFPTRLAADVVHVGGQFNVLERPVAKVDTTEWSEQKQPTDPFHTFVDLSDGSEGLAIVAQGMREYEAMDNDDRVLALTIHRSVQCLTYLCAPEHEEMDGAQALGEHTTRYAVVVHSGQWDDANLYVDALGHNTPIKVAQHTRTTGSAPRELSYLSIGDTNVVLSALKKAEDGDSIIARVYNPTNAAITTTLTSHFPLAEAHVVNLLEERQEALAVDDANALPLTVKSKQILTVELVAV